MENKNEKDTKINNLGSLLRYYREKRDLSLAQMSELTQMSASYLNRIELNKRKNPSISIIMKLSSALNIPIQELLKLFTPEEDINREGVQSIAEILFYNNFSIAGRRVDKNEVEILADTIETIYDFQWEGEDKNKEVMELLNLIDRLKEIA